MSEKTANTPHFGRFEFEDGSIYEGCFTIENDKKVRNGQGTLTFSSNSAVETKFERYSGQWRDDAINGFGVYDYISGARYTGEWSDNQHHGRGKYDFPDGSFYEGEWANHLMHGEGSFVSPSGQRWTGEFREGNFNSKMQNELKAQKRIEVKKKNISAEVTAFLKQLELDLYLDKKTLKTKVTELFVGGLEEEVALTRSSSTSRSARSPASRSTSSRNGSTCCATSATTMPH